MKKTLSLFQRNYEGDRLVRDELAPGAEWVAAAGRGLSEGLGPLPEPDLLVDCAQGFVRGWTETALADVLRLAAFGAWAAREFRDSLADVDGGSAQDAMERLGVIAKHTVAEPCGDGCVCAEYGDFPHECFKFAPGVARLMNPRA